MAVWVVMAVIGVTSLCCDVTIAQPCNLSTQYPQHGRCCDKCPPGHRMVEWCTAESPTRCEPCPSDFYNPHYNNVHNCIPCRRCKEVSRQVVKEPCTPIQDTRCGCEDGQYEVRPAIGGSLFWCCPNCPAGQQLVKECDPVDFTTSCAPCPPGTFSNGNGSPCRNHTRIDLLKTTTTADPRNTKPTVEAKKTGLWIAVALGILATIGGLVFCLHKRDSISSVCQRGSPCIGSTEEHPPRKQGNDTDGVEFVQVLMEAEDAARNEKETNVATSAEYGLHGWLATTRFLNCAERSDGSGGRETHSTRPCDQDSSQNTSRNDSSIGDDGAMILAAG